MNKHKVHGYIGSKWEENETMNKYKVHGYMGSKWFAVIIYTSSDVQEVFELLYPMATFSYSESFPNDNPY